LISHKLHAGNNSYFHMIGAVGSLFRFEARGVGRVMQNRLSSDSLILLFTTY
jgi:hypothetical protein